MLESEPQKQVDHAADAAGSTRAVLLADGALVPVREIRATDGVALQRFHSRLSEKSVYRRFFQPVPRLDDQRAEYFTTLDGCIRRALVALDPQQPEEIIAVVRYDRDPGSDGAEYAVVVEDRWQHHGLGLAISRLLLADARANGIKLWYALVLTENHPMLSLFKDLGLPITRRRDEIAVIRVEIDLTASETA